MTSIYWILQHLADVPDCDDWLSPDERNVRERLWAPKRVRDWRLGRWTAKCALLRAGSRSSPSPDLGTGASISILATNAGVPYALESGRESAWALSLSHSGEHGLCVVVRRPAVVGCDIETVGRRGEEFVVDWFTEAERAVVDALTVAEERSRAVTAVWSAKESALKALGVGLRLDTREVEVELTGPGLRSSETGLRTPDFGLGDHWSPLVVRAPGGPLHGWARSHGDQVMTIVADPPPGIPVAL